MITPNGGESLVVVAKQESQAEDPPPAIVEIIPTCPKETCPNNTNNSM
jgi:hypothetical protein